MPKTALLRIREFPMPYEMPSTRIIWVSPLPTIDITVNSMIRYGNACQASTNLWSTKSNLPPMYPDSTPMKTATTT